MVEVKQLRQHDLLWRHLQGQWQTAEYKFAERTSFVYILTRWDLSIVTNTKASLCSDVLSERVLYAIFHRASVKYCVIRAFTRVAGRRSYNTKLALFIYLDKRYHCQRNPDYNDSWMFEVHWRIAHYYHSCLFHQYIRWYLNYKNTYD